MIIGVVQELLTHEQITLYRAECCKITVADIVLGGYLTAVIFIDKKIPCGNLFLGKDIGIIEESENTPHIACGVFIPVLAVYLIGLECFPDKRRNISDVIVVFVLLIEEIIRIRNKLILCHKLHDHVFRRTYKIEFITECEHVVELFVGSEAAVLHMYSLSVGLIVPLFEILIECVLAKDVTGLKIDEFIISPAAFVDILFPVADSYCDHIIGCGLYGNYRD